MEAARKQMEKGNIKVLMQLYKTCEEVIMLIEENLDVYDGKGNSQELEKVLAQLLNQVQKIVG